jgi:hypothetical protein
MNTNVMSFLVGCIVTSALTYGIISTKNTFYGADIYYRDGRHVSTESGRIDSTFFTAQQAADFLEQYSADDFNRMEEDWRQSFVYEDMSVLVFEDGEVLLTYLDNKGSWTDIELCRNDCDNYGNCLYYVEYSDVGEFVNLK